MAWIKRNLFFVIGGLVALGLLGFAGYYNFTRWQANARQVATLNDKYTELKRLNDLKPNPGNAKVDNIAAARDQEQQIRDLMAKAADKFTPIAPIPDTNNVTSEDFAAALRETVDQMQRDAASASVIVPPRYNFSFEAQRQLMLFDPSSLNALAVQLGEVKAICDIFNDAKVNSLNAIRRERVSADDANGPQTDYINVASENNGLAVISTYEVTFQCFTPELAAVLSGFANSPFGIVVKGLNVAPVSETSEQSSGGNGGYGGYGGYGEPAYAVTVPHATAGGLQTVIDEKQLRVTMQLKVVKLLPRK